MHMHLNLNMNMNGNTTVYMVRRLAFPAHPPQLYGLVGVGGVLACAESGLASWVVSCCGRPGVTERAGILLTQAYV